jgi:hypothetical protein
MDSKLTLSINKEIAKRAKFYAKNRGRSLSDLVENYLKLLITTDSESIKHEYSPRVKELLGSVSVPDDFDYKKDITDYLTEKYL